MPLYRFKCNKCGVTWPLFYKRRPKNVPCPITPDHIWVACCGREPCDGEGKIVEHGTRLQLLQLAWWWEDHFLERYVGEC